MYYLASKSHLSRNHRESVESGTASPQQDLPIAGYYMHVRLRTGIEECTV